MVQEGFTHRRAAFESNIHNLINCENVCYFFKKYVRPTLLSQQDGAYDNTVEWGVYENRHDINVYQGRAIF